MTITVHSMCTYYPDWARKIEERSQELWATFKFCRAVKSAQINMYLYLPATMGGGKIDQNNVGRARTIFGRYVRSVVHAHGEQSALLVPVPSKDSFGEQNFRSLNMIRQAMGMGEARQIVPALRYNTQLGHAAQGGPRFVDELRPYMDCTENVAGRTVILVDDIKTSGSSILLAKEKIEAAGGFVQRAIVCGRTTDERANPWTPVTEDLLEPMDYYDDF